MSVNGDTTVEPNETFFVNLTSPVNATLGDPQAIGTIVNNDASTNTINFANFKSITGLTLVGSAAKSENVLRAFAASPDGTLRIALVGSGGPLADRADIALRVRADATAHIQAGHIAVLHAICEALERRFDRSLD